MTTLRIEVGRRGGTTVQDVVDGLIKAGCMKYVELDPDGLCFLPVDDLSNELAAAGFHVAIVPWPEPPPPTLWRRVLAWPRRVYFWARRVILRETMEEQLARVLADAYCDGPGAAALHEISTRESPMMRTIRRDAGDGD